MYEKDRLRLIDKLNSADVEPKSDESVSMLNEIIYTDYICEHEYGVRRVNPNNKKAECLCLDCGDAVSEFGYQKLYNSDNKTSLRNIRREYLKLLQEMSSHDCVQELCKESGLKLRRVISHVTIKD